jgi:predicted HTH transcriptional regulator
LIEAYEQLMAFVAKHLPDKFYLQGSQRRSLRTLIFREVVANTLVHREYTNAYPAKLVIGPDNVTVENANNPHGNGPIDVNAFSSYPKNPTIARFFIQLGRVEELGSGVMNIHRLIKEYTGNQVSPQFIEGVVFRTVIPVPAEGDTANDTVNDTANDTVNGGVNATNDESDTTNGGADTVNDGSDTINGGADTANDGSDTINELTDTINGGANAGTGGSDTINGGSDTVNDTVNEVLTDAFEQAGIRGVLREDYKLSLILTTAEIYRQKEGASLESIVKATGKSAPTVKRYLQLLKELGLVEFLGSKKSGKYLITETFEKLQPKL